jgi:apolipoprotein N-acyltransferase
VLIEGRRSSWIRSIVVSLLDPPLPVRALLAAAAGGFAVLAFAPFSLAPAAVVSLALLYELLAGRSPREGFRIGWAFGAGFLGFGVFWIRISLNEFGNMAIWLAHLLTFLFILLMALYYGLLGWLTARFSGGRSRAGHLLAFPALWVLLEWLRGWFLTGFPWLTIGNSQIDGPLAGFAPLVGVYGLSLLVALSAGLLWGLARRPGRARMGAAVLLALLWLAGWWLYQRDWTEPAGEPIRAAVLQANIPQSVKWNPDTRIPTLRAYVELTRESFGNDVIVWPETAVPDFLERVREPLIQPLASEARDAGAELVIGIPVLDREQSAYYNGLLSVGDGEDLYLKRHLVPFGEFIPFKNLLGPLAEIFEVPMSDFSSGGADRPLLRVGPHQTGASICYEDAFAAEVVQALPEAAYLINVSNDAWFGDSLAPRQHLAIARMRSLENERWMLRSTNTGISAIIDHKGRVVGSVPAFERGSFSADLQPRAGATPFVHVGNRFAVIAAISMLTVTVLVAWRPRRLKSPSP